jgi:hypothetical protein
VIKVNIIITASKLLAFIVLAVGSVYSFIYKDPSVITVAMSMSAVLMGAKTVMNQWGATRGLEYSQNLYGSYSGSSYNPYSQGYTNYSNYGNYMSNTNVNNVSQESNTETLEN